MNIDERIDNCMDMGDSLYDQEREAIKQLLTDVLEEVKPERLDRSNDPWEPKSDGPTLDHNIPTLQAWGYNAAIYEMEAKQRELGL